MQQNPNDVPERMSGTSGTGGPGGASGSETNRLAANLGDTSGDRSATAFSDTSGTLGAESLAGGHGTMERRKGEAREKMRQVKERAATFKTTLADKLEAGAERLRQRATTTTAAEAGAEAETRMRSTGTRMASGMESAAKWLRNADAASVKSDIENQVRTNPGRTLLVALGLGYVVGRALRGGRRG